MTKFYKVGDRVKIVKRAIAGGIAWNSLMTDTIGKLGTVVGATTIHGAHGTRVKIDGATGPYDDWCYVPESLEPADVVTIDFTKQIKDSTGAVQEILTTEAKGEFPVIYRSPEGVLYRAKIDGTTEGGIVTLGNQLAKGVGYVNVYRRHDGKIELGSAHPTLEASKRVGHGIARVKIEYTEGVFQE